MAPWRCLPVVKNLDNAKSSDAALEHVGSPVTSQPTFIWNAANWRRASSRQHSEGHLNIAFLQQMASTATNWILSPSEKLMKAITSELRLSRLPELILANTLNDCEHEAFEDCECLFTGYMYLC